MIEQKARSRDGTVLGSTPSGRGEDQFAEEEARSRDEGFLESTPSARTKRVYPLTSDERFWGLRLRGEGNTNSLIEEEARSRDEGSWSLRLRGGDNTSLSTEEETRGSGV
jgi:hypothetical protein